MKRKQDHGHGQDHGHEKLQKQKTSEIQVIGKLGSGTYGDVYALNDVSASLYGAHSSEPTHEHFLGPTLGPTLGPRLGPTLGPTLGPNIVAFKMTKPHVKKSEHFSETLDAIREMYGLSTAALLRGIVTHADRIGFILPIYGAPIGNETVPLWPVEAVAATLRPIAERLSMTRGLHRDIKAANIVLAKTPGEDAALIDFSLCTFAETCIDDAVTTLQYRAPEIIMSMQYGRPADIWSFGMVLFNVLMGFHFTSVCTEAHKVLHSIDIMNAFGWADWPEYAKALEDTLGSKNVPTSRPPQGYFDFVNILISNNGVAAAECAADLLKRILRPKPSDRLTWPQILEHPFWAFAKASLKQVSPVLPTKLSVREHDEIRSFLSVAKINDCVPQLVNGPTLKQRFYAVDHMIYYGRRFGAVKSTIFKAFKIWEAAFGLHNSESSRPFGTEIQDIASALLLAIAYNEDFRIMACDYTWAKWAFDWDSTNEAAFQFEAVRLLHLSKGLWPADNFDQAMARLMAPPMAHSAEAFKIDDKFLETYGLFLCAAKFTEVPGAFKTLQFMLAETPRAIISV